MASRKWLYQNRKEMTQEEKQLLLKDLCGRLPYQPICEFTDTEDDFCTTTATLGYSLRDFIAGKVLIKPYLRPMSSMTEEEKAYYFAIDEEPVKCIDWLNAHYFDYRGLIPIGLALPASEDMYNIKYND